MIAPKTIRGPAKGENVWQRRLAPHVPQVTIGAHVSQSGIPPFPPFLGGARLIAVPKSCPMISIS
jgi:hypothetical protein